MMMGWVMKFRNKGICLLCSRQNFGKNFVCRLWGSCSGGYEELSILWDMALCSPLEVSWHFGGTCWLPPGLKTKPNKKPTWYKQQVSTAHHTLNSCLPLHSQICSSSPFEAQHQLSLSCFLLVHSVLWESQWKPLSCLAVASCFSI
jgi:hypothetical protein